MTSLENFDLIVNYLSGAYNTNLKMPEHLLTDANLNTGLAVESQEAEASNRNRKRSFNDLNITEKARGAK